MAINTVSVIFLFGLYFIDEIFSFFVVGTANTTMDMIRAITPPSFDGMDRRIA